MWKKIALGSLAALTLAGGTALAQRDRGYNPLEDFLGRIGRDNTNRPLQCAVTRRLGRDGDIVYLRMECRADGRVYGR